MKAFNSRPSRGPSLGTLLPHEGSLRALKKLWGGAPVSAEARSAPVSAGSVLIKVGWAGLVRDGGAGMLRCSLTPDPD